MWCSLGSEEKTHRALAEARQVAEPMFEHIGPIPYPVLQRLMDPLYPPSLQWYWKGDFIREIPDEAIQAHHAFSRVPTAHSLMHLYPVDGAAHRVSPDATAWAHRDANGTMVIVGVNPDPANADRITGRTRDHWQAVHPHSAGASYVNFMMEEGPERIRASYGQHDQRLQRVKAVYDPANFFHLNQNMVPAA